MEIADRFLTYDRCTVSASEILHVDIVALPPAAIWEPFGPVEISAKVVRFVSCHEYVRVLTQISGH
jgi:hypothetical protein